MLIEQYLKESVSVVVRAISFSVWRIFPYFFFYIPKDEFKSTLHFFFVFTVEDDAVVGQLVFVEDLFQLAARAGIHVMRSGSVALIKVGFVRYRCIIAKKVVCRDLEYH